MFVFNNDSHKVAYAPQPTPRNPAQPGCSFHSKTDVRNEKASSVKIKKQEGQRECSALKYPL